MADLHKKVGWIGLGIMGRPMVSNLLAKMDSETQFYVYDVVQKSIDDFVEEGQGRVHACSSSKEVADLSVRHTPTTGTSSRFPERLTHRT
jgi:3-hydroxyisobutyrate dehydrogenase